MKVAFVNQPLDLIIPPYQNSIGIWTYKVAPYVAQRYDVTVFGKKSLFQKKWNEPENINYHFISSIPNKVVSKFWGFFSRNNDPKLPSFASIYYNLDYILPIALLIRYHKFDIVHIHNFTQFVPVVRSLNHKAKIVLHMNCEWLSQLDYDLMESRINQADLVLGSSEYISEKIHQRFPKYTQRCQTVHNGVDTDIFVSTDSPENKPANDDLRIIFVGRVSPEKGVHVLVEAFRIIAEQIPQAKLDIIGPIGAMPIEFLVNLSDDPQVAKLASLYNEDYGTLLKRLVPPHLANRVNFLGGVPHTLIKEYYQKADILVNPSFSESFGMSLVEAMACGKPVIATRVGGMVEIVGDEKVGLLVDQGDVSALSEAILLLLKDKELRQSMGKFGYQRVHENYSWLKISNNLVENYNNLMASE